MPRFFETPLGLKDYTPGTLIKIEEILARARAIAGDFAYQGIRTPIMEYYQTVGLASQIREDELIRFAGPLGRMVTLRPDLTTPLARVAASTYRDLPPPFRFFAYGDVYRNDAQGFIEEKTQIDFELIGQKSLEADGEIINIAARIIANFAPEIQITLGHTGIMTILLEENVREQQTRDELTRALQSLDYVGYGKIIADLPGLSPEGKKRLLEILTIKGPAQILARIEDWYKDNPAWLEIFAEIRLIEKILAGYDLAENLIFDPCIIGRHKYYRGIIFNIYAAGSPWKIASGGRYDGLIAKFGRDLAGTGMAIDVVELAKLKEMS